MRNISYVLVLLSLVIPIGCCDDPTMNIDPMIHHEGLITGYNVRWRDLADFDSSNVLALTDSLQPQMLRYPGGSLAYKWDWKTGRSTEDQNMNDVAHPISDLKRMANYTDSKIIFVLDIINSTIQDQIEMLYSADLHIKYIEIGNELYLDAYEEYFPSAQIYADTINSWLPQIIAHFPDAKFGVAMIGRDSNVDRKKTMEHPVGRTHPSTSRCLRISYLCQ